MITHKDYIMFRRLGTTHAQQIDGVELMLITTEANTNKIKKRIITPTIK